MLGAPRIKKPARSGPAFFMNGSDLFQRKNPRYQCFDVGIADMRIGRHRNRAPYSLASFLHFFFQFGLGACVILILGRDIL